MTCGRQIVVAKLNGPWLQAERLRRGRLEVGSCLRHSGEIQAAFELELKMNLDAGFYRHDALAPRLKARNLRIISERDINIFAKRL